MFNNLYSYKLKRLYNYDVFSYKKDITKYNIFNVIKDSDKIEPKLYFDTGEGFNEKIPS